MIAGVVAVAVADQLEPVWHLVDVAGWPLIAYCGEQAPEPMRRRVRSAQPARFGAWCLECRRAQGPA